MKNTIEKSIELNVPIYRVWTALTDSQQFGEWFKVSLIGPFVVDQKIHGQITHPGYEHIKFEAHVRKMEEPNYFSFTWHPYAIDETIDYASETPTLVEFNLEEKQASTLLTVIETGFDKVPNHRKKEAYEKHESGWSEQLENIQNYLTNTNQIL